MAKEKQYYVVYSGYSLGVKMEIRDCLKSTYYHPQGYYRAYDTLDQARDCWQHFRKHGVIKEVPKVHKLF